MKGEERYRGSCGCGKVRYELHAPPRATVMCHCSQCRKATGTAFGTWALVPKDAFRWTNGTEQIGEFKSSDHALRLFCKECGATLGNLTTRRPDFFHLAAGTLDVTLPLNVILHVYASSKADWYEILDDTPRHDTEPAPQRTSE